MGERIATAFGDVNAIIAQKASDIWTGFLGAAQTGFGKVKAFFAQTPFEIGYEIGQASGIGQMITAALNLMSAFYGGVVTGFTNVKAFFDNIPAVMDHRHSREPWRDVRHYCHQRLAGLRQRRQAAN